MTIIELVVESMSKTFKYENPNGKIIDICYINAKDKDGNDYKAVASDNTCWNIRSGSKVLVNKYKNKNNFVVLKVID